MKRVSSWQFLFAAIVVVLLFLLLLFRHFLGGSAVLMTTDASISTANKSAAEVWVETYANWDSGILLGLPRGSSTQMSSILKAFVPGIVWNNLACGLAGLVASFVFLAAFGRKLSVCGPHCVAR